MSKLAPFIYVFLKNEQGVTITLMQLLSQVPISQTYKTITDKLKLKGKSISFSFKGSILDETKSLKEQGVTNYGDIFLVIQEEAQVRAHKSDKLSVLVTSNNSSPKKPYSIQPTPANQANQIMKPNWANFGMHDVISTKNVMPSTVHAIIDESMSLGSPLNNLEKKSPLKKAVQNVQKIAKTTKKVKEIITKQVSQTDQKMIKKICFIQAVVKGKKAKKIYSMRVKKLRYRQYIIEELVTSEEKYKNSLFCIKNNVILKFREKKFLTKDEESTVFSTLETITEFSQNLFSILNGVYKNNFVRYKTKIADLILNLMPYFKVYTPYFNNFDMSRQFLEKLRKNNPKIAAWLNENEHKPQLEGQDLNSLLIKPIQRLPKYVLLFKDLKKNTEESHPDYNNIVHALEKFEQINNELNSKMKEYLRKLKIFELQQLFGDPKLQILEANREFLEEEAISLILNDIPRQAILYFLTDLLIVAGRINNNDWKLLKAVFLDGNSFVRDQQDTQYFENVFTVYGKETMTLCTDTSENKLRLMEMIRELIKNLKARHKNRDDLKKFNKGKTLEIIKKLQQSPVEIKIVGTIKRGLKNFNPYTVYIIQITKENWRQCIYFRYSELLKLDELVKKEYSGIVITHFPPKNWLNGQKPQVIESRKLLIEPFLQSLLQNEKIIEKSRKVLSFLGLPMNFYEIEAEQNKENIELEYAKESHMAKTLIKNQSVLRLLSSINRGFPRIQTLTYIQDNSMYDKITQEIEITLMNNTKITLTISKQTKASDLCRDIAHKINLLSWLDFRLFLHISGSEERRLEDDEYIYRVLSTELNDNEGKGDKMGEIIAEEFNDSGDESRSRSPMKSIQKTNKFTSFFKDIKDSFNKGIKKIKTETKKLFSSEYKLIFKKYLYLDKEIEQIDLTNDPVKLDLVTNQIFQEVFNLYYILSCNDYCLIAALAAYLKFGSMTAVKANDFLHVMEEKSLKENIPDEVYYKKEKEFWVNNVGENWKSFSEGIIKIAEVNKKMNFETNSAMLKSFGNKKQDKLDPFASKRAIHNININLKPVDPKIIAKFLTLDSISKCELYGSHCFWVNYEGNLKKKSKDFGWLAISFNKIGLLNPKKVFINKVNYENVKNYKTFPDSFELTFEGNVTDLMKQTRSLKFLSFHQEANDSSDILQDQKSKEDLNDSRKEIVTIRFYTNNSFEIFQLIENYSFLRKLYYGKDQKDEQKN